MDRDCAATLSKVKALAQPSGPTDFVVIVSYVSTVLQLQPAFYQRAEALVAQVDDRVELIAKWLEPAESNFAMAKPVYVELLAAARAGNAAETTKLVDKVNSLPDDSGAVSTYLASYGLTDCASLEAS